MQNKAKKGLDRSTHVGQAPPTTLARMPHMVKPLAKACAGKAGTEQHAQRLPTKGMSHSSALCRARQLRKGDARPQVPAQSTTGITDKARPVAEKFKNRR